MDTTDTTNPNVIRFNAADVDDNNYWLTETSQLARPNGSWNAKYRVQWYGIKDHWYYPENDKVPNWFHRLMQGWILGLRWELNPDCE